MFGMHIVDLVILIIIALSVMTGFARGFFKEGIALSVWVMGFWMAYHYAPEVAHYLQNSIHDAGMRKIISFVLIVIVTILGGGILNAILSMIVKRTGLSGTDRLLGAVFGFLRGIIVVSLIMLVLQITGLSQESWMAGSILYTRFLPMVAWMHGHLPQVQF